MFSNISEIFGQEVTVLMWRLSDVFDKLNGPSSSLRGETTNVFQSLDKFSAILKESMLYKILCDGGTQESFVRICEYLREMTKYLKKLNLMLWLIFLYHKKYFKNLFP
jgi:hypothetical protein